MNGNFFTKSRPSYTGNYLYQNPSGVSLPASIRTDLENNNFNAAAATLLSYSQGNAARVSNGNPAVTIGCDGKILMTYYVSVSGDDAGTLVFQYFGPEFRIDSVSVSPNPVNIRRGDTKQLAVTANYSDDSEVPVTNASTYRSANTSIATINYRGLVTGKAVGTTTVIATYGGKSKAVTVNVRYPDVMSISVSPSSANIKVGVTKQLTTTAYLSDGTNQNVTGTASYGSANTSIASVSSGGLVTGKAVGTTTVTATYSGKSAASTVNVTVPDNNKPIARFSVTPNPVFADEQVTYTDTSYDPDGYGLSERRWRVSLFGTSETHEYYNELPPNVFGTTGWGENNDGVGVYLITLWVKDDFPYGSSYELWSDPVSQVLIVEDSLRITALRMNSIVNPPSTTVAPIDYPAETPALIKAGYKMTFQLNTNGGDEAEIKFYANGQPLTVYTDAATDGTDTITVGTNRKNSVDNFSFWTDKNLEKNTIIDIKVILSKNGGNSIVNNVLGWQALKVVDSAKKDSNINLIK
jgi:hypothetical protein